MPLDNYSCSCSRPKKYHLTFDGGKIIGIYHLDVCEKCNANIEKNFLIKEDTTSLIVGSMALSENVEKEIWS